MLRAWHGLRGQLLQLRGQEVRGGSQLRDQSIKRGELRTVSRFDRRQALIEADAAIVYATDAKIEPEVKVVLELPTASHPPIVYPIAALANGAHTDAAKRFVEHVRSDAAQAIFLEAGFAPPP